MAKALYRKVGLGNAVYFLEMKSAIIFDRPEMKYVRAKMYLASHLDR